MLYGLKSLRRRLVILLLQSAVTIAIGTRADSQPASMSDMPAMAGMSHDIGAMTMAVGGLPESRDASGTSWQPDSTPLHAHHSMIGDWSFMTHYNAFVAYDHQSGPRGDDQFNSINWLMLMASRQTDSDQITFRGMFSLEPWTTTTQGYPLLFQSGEAYHG